MVAPQKALKPSRESIFHHIKGKPHHSILLRELMREMRVPKSDRGVFQGLLKELVEEGKLARIRNNRYGLPKNDNLISGRLQAHPDGYGFVIPDVSEGGDLFIAKPYMLGAMHGDTVTARLQKSSVSRSSRGQPRREGRIVRILVRKLTRVVGRFEWTQKHRLGIVVPTDNRNRYPLLISADRAILAREGDLVSAEILRYPTVRHDPEGRVIDVIGPADDPKIDGQMVMAEFSLPMRFPEEVDSEAQSVPDRVSPSITKHRRDLREMTTVTIDGETAKDFDDAVSIELLHGSEYRLWVHVADVSHYVLWNSRMDLEARKRATSVYFPDQVIPMLPERLSNGICSLNPKEDRLAMTVEMKFDGRGNRIDFDIYESTIQSDGRLTYHGVSEVLEDPKNAAVKTAGRFVEDLKMMQDLSQRIRTIRFEEGSIDFDLPEPQIILDIQGNPIDIIIEERNVAHQIIEEFMIAANRAVAEFTEKEEILSLYRVHEPPDEEKIKDLAVFVSNFGYSLKSQRKKKGGAPVIPPKALQGLLASVKDRPEEKLINHVVLRSMKQARYAVDPLGHFGLATEHYTHFTSPIRRYPDLMVHRFIKQVKKKQRDSNRALSELSTLLPEIARTSSEGERRAMEAEREIVSLKKVRFMDDKVNEEFFGLITGVTAFGFFVELENFFVEGLVHIASIQGDYYIFLEKEHCLVGRSKKRRFRIADRVKVRVERVDIQKRKMDFILAEEVDQISRPRRRR